jgi:uncharacterized protein (TIGR01777 family)
MTIVLAGGTGFLGRALTAALSSAGHQVLNLSRRPRPGNPHDIAWMPDGTAGPWASVLDAADVVINLAGEGIADRRWSAERKAALRTSRILPTRSLALALKAAAPRPRRFITSSAIGVYGAHDDEVVTEVTAPGTDFLSSLCVEWEAEATRAASPDTRVHLLRTGIVLHPDGGALKSMLPPFRLGVGGPMGHGRQYMPWIHLDDWVRLAVWLAEGHGDAAAPVAVWNGTAPAPVSNAEFGRTLGRVLHRPAILPAPAVALRLWLGEFAQFLLTGARVIPAAAAQHGFQFRFPTLESALRDLLGH